MIYSPSSRDEFAFCPRKYWLRKQGWVTRTIDYPELCAIGGSAVGKAMEVWNKELMNGFETKLLSLKAVARAQLDYEIFSQFEIHNRIRGGGKCSEFAEQLPDLVSLAIDLLWAGDPLKPYAILAAEEEYKQYGNSRSDVRVKQADGRQIIFDYKCKFGEVDVKWIEKNFEQYAQGEQRFTYTTAANVDMFGIIMVLLKPTDKKKLLDPRVEVRTWPVTEYQKQMWLRDAQLMTPAMSRALEYTDPRQVQGRPYPHGNQFGECAYYKACMDYGLDEEKMKLDYIQIERKD